MPAYNAAKYLQKSVGSVIAQSFGDWELLVINDGSSDNTGALAGEFAARDSRIRVISQDNAGVSAARNRGMREARGELIAFLDADDALESDFLSDMLSAMDTYGGDCAACSHVREYDDGHTEEERFPLSAGLHSGSELTEAIVLPLLCDRLKSDLFNGFIWRYLFSRDLIADNNIRFSGAYLEDELFLIEYFSYPVSLAVCEKPLYRYYQNPGSVTRNYLPGYVDTFLASLEIKHDLIRRFRIPVYDYWENNTCWAGLLIAIGNIFAPGNRSSFCEKIAQLKTLRAIPEFSRAVSEYTPENMNRNKTIVAKLYSHSLYLPLAAMYTIKNRRRA
jgi:glycosyltransferase EpsJ